jgi:hypothetical protein
MDTRILVRNRTVRFSAVLSIYTSKTHIPTMPVATHTPCAMFFHELRHTPARIVLREQLNLN